MAEYLIKDTTLTEIADAVRAKTKKTDTILVSDLAEEIAGISGGADLNFEVVGGTTEPSNPIENTIWVNTSNTITSWIFSATQPNSPTEGMVWISTGISSEVEFNALKENNVQVYPISAKQYIGDAWVFAETKSYQMGVWVNWWHGELYENGDQYTYYTGGFGTFKAHGQTNWGTATFNENNIVIQNASGSSGIGIYTKKGIDVTNYTKLEVTLSSGSLYRDGNYRCAVSLPTSTASFNWSCYTSITSTGTTTLDISKMSGLCYPTIAINGSTAGFSMTITKIKLS